MSRFRGYPKTVPPLVDLESSTKDVVRYYSPESVGNLCTDHDRRQDSKSSPKARASILPRLPENRGRQKFIPAILILSGLFLFLVWVPHDMDKNVHRNLADEILARYNVHQETIWWKNHTERLSRVYEFRENFSWCIPEKTATHDWRLNSKWFVRKPWRPPSRTTFSHERGEDPKPWRNSIRYPIGGSCHWTRTY